MELHDFEQWIERRILLRGLDYFEEGCVEHLRYDEQREAYVADVHGSALYQVEIQLEADGSVFVRGCNCPYDQGEFCKHQVAVLYALREEVDQIKRVPHQRLELEDVLKHASREQLVEFLLVLAREDEAIGEKATIYFQPLETNDEMQSWTGLFDRYYDELDEHYGILPDYLYAQLYRDVSLMMAKSRQQAQAGNNREALEWGVFVIGELLKLRERMDDGEDVTSWIKADWQQLLDQLCGMGAFSLQHVSEWIDNVVEKVERAPYGHDQDVQLLLLESGQRLLCQLPEVCATDSLYAVAVANLNEALTKFVETINASAWNSRRLQERVEMIRYRLMMHGDGERAALQYAERRMEMPMFRELLVRQALEVKDIERALALVQEAIDSKVEGPSMHHDWRDWEYQILKAEDIHLSSHIERARQLAMGLLLDGVKRYYVELKSLYDTRSWTEVYQNVLRQLELQTYFMHELYTHILLEERDFARLLYYVQKHPRHILEWYPYLMHLYPNEVAGVFDVHIRQYAEQASNRKQYRYIAYMIGELKKAGGREQAERIVVDLLKQYDRRSALRDELRM